MPFETGEERQALRESCREHAKEWLNALDVDKAAAFGKVAAATIPVILDALELEQGKDGGQFAEQVRNLVRDRFMVRKDGHEMLRNDVRVWNFGVQVLPSGMVIADIRLAILPPGVTLGGPADDAALSQTRNRGRT